MTTYNVVNSKSATLGAATVDIVNLSRPADRIRIDNLSATNPIYANVAGPTLPPPSVGPQPAAPTPTVAGDNSAIVVPPNGSVTYPLVGRAMIGTVALISTGAQAYSVVSVP